MKKIEGFKIIVMSFFLLLGNISLATITHKNCHKECLTKVFAKKGNSKKQLILKLYCNNDYELLSFSMRRKKKIEYRETGTYKNYGPVFKFNAIDRVHRIHKDFLFLKKDGKMYTSFFDLVNKKSHSLLPENNDTKYFDSTYVDRYFGIISTLKKDEKKFIEKPKTLWYPTYSLNGTFLSKDSLSLINVVFVVGKLESDDILNRTLELAEYLKSTGVNVTVYPPPTSWATIVEGSKNAHVFLYAGHGNGDGLYLAEGQISSKMIKQDLKLQNNAIVLFNHVCFGAGSSASDKSKLSDQDATRRVEEYSKTFIEMGVGGYYANNTCGSMFSFFERFLSQNPLKEIVMNSRQTNYNVVVTENPYKYNSTYEILVTCNENREGYSTITTYKNGVKSVTKRRTFPSYGLAYVGNPQLTIKDLLKK